MNKLIFLLGGTALGIALYKILNAPQPGYGYAGVDRAAADVGAWGTKNRVAGAGGQLLGKLEQGVGSVAGNPDLNDQGVYHEATSAVQNAAGKVAQAVGETIHDLNK